MAKTDYSRVENALEEGLRRLNVSQLLEYADSASKIGSSGDESQRDQRQRSAELSIERKKERRLLAAAMQYDIDRLFKKDYHLYTALGTHFEEITDLLKRADSLKNEEWERFQTIKTALAKYKEAKEPPTPDNDLVEQERLRHINKRFNTNDKWLPLH